MSLQSLDHSDCVIGIYLAVHCVDVIRVTGPFTLCHWDLLCLSMHCVDVVDFTGLFRLCHWDLLGCVLCRCH